MYTYFPASVTLKINKMYNIFLPNTTQICFYKYNILLFVVGILMLFFLSHNVVVMASTAVEANPENRYKYHKEMCYS